MRRAILVFALAAPVAAIALWHFSPLAAVGLVAASHALILIPTLRPTLQWLGPVMTAFETDEPELWLTIDDGPTADTPALLDMLEARGAKATFFLKGILAQAHPDLVREILRRGHGVANHSFSHPSGAFWCLPPGAIGRQIDGCNEAIKAVTGVAPSLFRAPVGTKNPAVHPALKKRGMTLVGWSARAYDTQTDDEELVVRRIVPRLAPGAIILMHQGRAPSIRFVERIVREAQDRGYRFVVPEAGRLKTKK